MKIVVFGATGNIGQRVVKEAIERGHQVISVVRQPKKSQTLDARAPLVKGDATNAASVAQLVVGNDAVINAISIAPGGSGADSSLTDAAHALIAGLTLAAVKRLVVVGGAGSLEVKPGVALMDTPKFPAASKAAAKAQRDALEVYREEGKGLNWTVFSPAAEIGPGERTGTFRLGEDELVTNSKGESRISYEDYAVALLDELEKPKHVRKRFTAAY